MRLAYTNSYHSQPSLPEPPRPSPRALQTSTAALQMSLQPITSGLVVLRNDWSTAASSSDVRRTPARTRQCRIAVRVTSPLKKLSERKKKEAEFAELDVFLVASAFFSRENAIARFFY